MLLATERYCHAEHFDRLTMRQYCEAYEILYPQIKRTTMQVVARSLASCPFAPRAVIMGLALEPVNISRPILLQSQVLGQLDMLRIIDAAGKRHAITLAERHDIGPSVVKRLRELKAAEIDTTLDENPALAEKVDKDEVGSPFVDIQAAARSASEIEKDIEPVVALDRDDEVEMVTRTIPVEELEQKIVQQLEAIPAAEAATDLLRAAARGGRLGKDAGTDSQVASAPAQSESAADLAKSLERIAAAKSRQGLAALMAKASSFSLETAFQVLEDTSGDTLAVFLKSHEIEPAAASRILMLTFPSIGLSTQNALRAVRFYKTLETESCWEAVDQWPKDEAPRAAHQPYLEESDGIRWSARDVANARRDVELEEARRQALG